MSTRFTALTVREGDAFLLEENNWRCLFDSGRYKTIVDLLKYKGIKKLDLAICSHNDADHADGFIALFKAGFQIDEIWLPGLWASVLQFVADNYRYQGEIEWDNWRYDGELDSLFSNERVSEGYFRQNLDFLGFYWNNMEFREFYDNLHDKLARHIIEDPRIIDEYCYHILRNLRDRDCAETNSEKQVGNYLEDSLRNWLPWSAHIILSHAIPEETQQELKMACNFKLKKILDIATLAIRHGCRIRWFEPLSSCTNGAIDYGFVPLNSREMCYVKKPKSGMAYMYLLTLTKENEHSLVFEYTKDGTPIIRFSADSNCISQSAPPYSEDIIVTAPHHGSPANANVYDAIRGNDIIWVRSDKLRSDRPCPEFKKRNKKYCLTCKKYNFTTEICFEYDPLLKKWDYVRGEQCRCR